MLVAQTTNGAKYAIPDFRDHVNTEKGNLPLVPNGAADVNLPVLKLNAQVRLFDLSNEKDLQDYRGLVTEISNAKSQCIALERNWDAENRKYYVYCEWVTGTFTMETTNVE